MTKLSEQSAIAVHGGAGTISKKSMSAQKEYNYKAALREAVYEGSLVLENGGSALKAVERAVTILEDCPLFNAGKGSVFDYNGKQFMEAAIMDGKRLRAGAVCNIELVKNPIQLARLVINKTKHVYISGQEAVSLAQEHGLAIETPEYFWDAFRYKQWKRAKKHDKVMLDHDETEEEKKWGTVGAVARDRRGNLAAATSTGGMTNKRYGRIGDSSVIGAGTYANNNTCAVSCTGQGEYFIRLVAAHQISMLMEIGGLSLEAAGKVIIDDKMRSLGGRGGMIGIDKQGNIAMQFNSRGMYRAYKKQGEEEFIGIYQ